GGIPSIGAGAVRYRAVEDILAILADSFCSSGFFSSAPGRLFSAFFCVDGRRDKKIAEIGGFELRTNADGGPREEEG
ncbi:MAG: hypothetical protein OEV36_11980, partial [Myxococcales bacterium]|nr:hypothetical protein [Myxococcales bacterium]